MSKDASFYYGNAIVDQVRDSGWFIGQFVQAAAGLRHQTEVEIKWGVHPAGERRPQPWATGHATTISVLIRGSLRVTFHDNGNPQTVTLDKEGDYVVFGPAAMHTWEAIGDTIVLSVRFPSVERWQAARSDQGSSTS